MQIIIILSLTFKELIKDFVFLSPKCFRIAAKHLDADLISTVLMALLKENRKDEAMEAVSFIVFDIVIFAAFSLLMESNNKHCPKLTSIKE